MNKGIVEFEEGSGNVFADIGVRHPEESLIRAKLAKQIGEIIQKKGFNQSQIASILGVDQPKVSKLVRGRISGFSSDRLLGFLTALGCDVRIEVRAPKASRRSGVRSRRGKVVVAAG
jgi:predicted XRE-type DNA-binding protein